MKKDIVQLVIAFFTLVFGGAAEELAPVTLGVGMPVLLSASVYFAHRRTPLVGVLFAIAAGAAEDALSGLPYALSVSFFAAVAGLLRGFKLPVGFAAPAYALYQVWLWIWLGQSLVGSVFLRTLAALPVGAAVLAATYAFLRWIDGKAAVDEK